MDSYIGNLDCKVVTIPKVNRYWNSDPSSLVECKRPETYDLCKSCELVNQLVYKYKMLKYALWISRAERASDKARIFYFAETYEIKLNIDGFSNKEKGRTRMCTARRWELTWLKVERKCRDKALRILKES